MFKEKIQAIWSEYKVGDKIQEDSFGITYKISKSEGPKQIFKIVRVISFPRNEDEITKLKNAGKTDAEIKNYYEKLASESINALEKIRFMEGKENVATIEGIRIKPRGTIGFDIYVLEDYLKPLILHLQTTQIKEEEVAILGANICDALTECHKRNIYHGSISPETISLSRTGKYKLLGAGMVKKNYFSSINAVFAAPELLKNDVCNEKSDIYSLGLVLYTLLGGTLPYSENDSIEEITSKKSVSKGLVLSDCSNDKLASAILRSVATDPQTRYSTAAEFKKAIIAAAGIIDTSENSNEGRIFPIYINGKAAYKTDANAPKVTAKLELPASSKKKQGNNDSDISISRTPTADNSIFDKNNDESDSPSPIIKISIAIVILGIIAALAFFVTYSMGDKNTSSENASAVSGSGDISNVSDTQDESGESDTESNVSETSNEGEISQISNDVASEDDSSEDASSEDASSKDASSEDSSSEDASSEDASGEDTSGEDASSEDASSEDASSEDSSSEDTSSEDSSSEDSSSEDASSEDIPSEDASSEDASSEDASSEDASSEDVSNDNTGNANTEFNGENQ